LDSVGEAHGAECESVEDLDAELSSEQLASLVAVARDGPQTRRGTPGRRQRLGSDRRDAEQRDDNKRQEGDDGRDQAPGRPAALQVVRADGYVDEGNNQQDECDLDDLLGQVVDSAGGEGLWSGGADPLQEANVDADAAG
jgi:hypothetical protein